MNRFFLIILTIVSLPVVSCIRNDIPYPEIDAAITSLDADGAKSVSISTDIHEVVLTLEETVDISKVNIREVSFNDEAVAASDPIVGTKDLSKPLTVTLSAYENERSWAIKAEQPIDRYFSLSGQIGGAVIDATNRRVVAQVPSGIDLTGMSVSSIKLGPEGQTTYSPAISCSISRIPAFNSPLKICSRMLEATSSARLCLPVFVIRCTLFLFSYLLY